MATGRKLKSMTPEGFYQSDEFADLEWNHMRSAILYTYLVRKADDYGFINLDRVMQLSGMEMETVSPLIEKGFIIRFRSGIAVIVHWGVHSRGEKARRNKTEYRGELAQLITDKYGNYSLKNDTENDTNNSQEMTQEMTREMTQNEETVDESDAFSEFMVPSRTGADIKQSKTYINQSKQSRDPKQSNNTQSFGATFSVDQKSAETASPNGSECVCSLPVLSEKKSSNGSHRSPRKSVLSADQQALFDKFYKAYPKKRAVAEAEKAWSKINPIPDETFTDHAIRVVQSKLSSGEWSKDRFRYIPHPATFLNEKGYLDDTEWAIESSPGEQLFTGSTVKVEKNPRGYDPSNGFSEEELERRKERSRQLARERGEL